MISDATAAELSSAAAFARFLADFDACRIPLAEWTHAAHLAMAAGRLLEAPGSDVFPRIRDGILHYAGCVGIPQTPDRGYHETLTRFWTHICAAFLIENGYLDYQGARALVALYGRRSDLQNEYYSFDALKSTEARRQWIVPDRKPLPAAWRRGELLVSTNPLLLQMAVVKQLLPSLESTLSRALRNSLCFGLYRAGRQIGIARVVTDLATTAVVLDSQTLDADPEVAHWLDECVRSHPSLESCAYPPAAPSCCISPNMSS